MLDWWDSQKGWRVQMQLVFLRANLSKWIPSLRGRDIEIDRAHRVYDGGRGSDRPRTLIFRVLRWHDRSDILKGARQAYPVKCAQNNVTHCCFFLTLVRLQASGERHWSGFEEDDCTWSPALLIYPAVIKLRHKGETEKLRFPQKAEDFISSMSQQKSYAAALRGDDGGAAAAVSPVRREGLTAGMVLVLAAQKGMIAGWTWMLAKPIVCVFFSYTGILSLFIRYNNDLFAGKTDTPFFCLEGTNGE